MIPITALILTRNEQENIGRTLSAIEWIEKVVIVDSFSSDQTLQIVPASHPNVLIVQREFDSFAGQCNFGLEHITTEWVLSLDADYLVTPELASEIQALEPASEVAGYSAEFRYCIVGSPLRGSVYPARTVLYRRRLAKYRDEGHGHRVTVQGKVEKLSGKIDHDDRKPLSHWVQSQNKYTKIEAKHLLAQPLEKLSAPDRLRRKIFFAAPVMFVYLLFGRGLILDGWPGWVYVCQRTVAELLLSLRLVIEKFNLRDQAKVRSY